MDATHHSRRRKRYWAEACLGAVTLALAILTVVWPDWVEIIFRIDSDNHSGSFEIAMTFTLAASSVLFFALGWFEFRRTLTAEVQSASGHLRP
jgi:hypothetical protein